MASYKANPVFEPYRNGAFELRMVSNQEELEGCQRLRYRIFMHELAGKPMVEGALDVDDFDPHCDHLMVIDHDGPAPKVIGTYRLLRREGMEKAGRFYTQTEFDVSKLVDSGKTVLELGRSCVDTNYRGGAVIQLLWRGLANYIRHYKVDFLFGCASFAGIDPMEHQVGLSYLHHYHLAPKEIATSPLPHMAAHYDILPKESINAKRAFVQLPALLKGYLRVGGMIGEGAIIDPDCKTVDVCIIVAEATKAANRYIERLKTSSTETL